MNRLLFRVSVGMLVGLGLVVAPTTTFADYGSGAVYQIEISANNVGQVPGDGAWIWVALNRDGTGDYAAADCVHTGSLGLNGDEPDDHGPEPYWRRAPGHHCCPSSVRALRGGFGRGHPRAAAEPVRASRFRRHSAGAGGALVAVDGGRGPIARVLRPTLLLISNSSCSSIVCNRRQPHSIGLAARNVLHSAYVQRRNLFC